MAFEQTGQPGQGRREPEGMHSMAAGAVPSRRQVRLPVAGSRPKGELLRGRSRRPTAWLGRSLGRVMLRPGWHSRREWPLDPPPRSVRGRPSSSDSRLAVVEGQPMVFEKVLQAAVFADNKACGANMRPRWGRAPGSSTAPHPPGGRFRSPLRRFSAPSRRPGSASCTGFSTRTWRGGVPGLPRIGPGVAVPVLASFLAVTLAVLVPAPLQAQTVTDLVSNTGLGTLGNQESRFAATSFTTGSHEAGYDLSEIQISVHSVPSTVPAGVVTLQENDSGTPGDLVATLTNPSSFTVGDELNSFAAPSGHPPESGNYLLGGGQRRCGSADACTPRYHGPVCPIPDRRAQAAGRSADFARFKTSRSGSWQSTSFKQQIVVRGFGGRPPT